MKKLLGIVVLGLLWCNVAYPANCNDELDHSWSYNSSEAKFEFKSRSSKTIYILKLNIISASGGVMKSMKNSWGYALRIKPYGFVTHNTNITSINPDLMSTSKSSYLCTYTEPKGTVDYSKNTKKKKSGFKWWYILVGLGILMAIGAIMEQAEKKGDSEKSTKTSSTTSTSSGSFIEDVWKGKKSLGETFWLYFIVINGIISFGSGYLSESNDNNIFLLAAIAANIWAGVGVWNSSTNYQLQKIKAKQPHGWAYAAKIAIVLNFLLLTSQVVVFLGIA
jgi:hypothetical protein